MPSRHRSARRRRQGSQARRTAVTVAIPVALAVVVGGIAIAITHGVEQPRERVERFDCASPAAY